jgi:hypothetical protein
MTGLDGGMPLPLRKIDCQGTIGPVKCSISSHPQARCRRLPAGLPLSDRRGHAPDPQSGDQCALPHDVVLRSPAIGLRSVRDDDGADDVVQIRAHESQRPPARSLLRVREVRADGCRFGGVDCSTHGELLN